MEKKFPITLALSTGLMKVAGVYLTGASIVLLAALATNRLANAFETPARI